MTVAADDAVGLSGDCALQYAVIVGVFGDGVQDEIRLRDECRTKYSCANCSDVCWCNAEFPQQLLLQFL